MEEEEVENPAAAPSSSADSTIAAPIAHPYFGVPASWEPLPLWLNENEWSNKECIPYAPWQISQVKPSSCILLHETDVAAPGTLMVIACGATRCAFSVQSAYTLAHDKVVLKVPKTKTEHNKALEDSMKDTSAMERLQHSDYIPDIYGNCGTSQLLEDASSKGTLYDQMVVAKTFESETDGLMNNPETNLRICYHLARSVADMHGIDSNNSNNTQNRYNDVVSFVHNDIDCENLIFVDGVFKLSDFHYASNEYKSRKTGVGCRTLGVGWTNKYTKQRAPEEFLNGKKKHTIRRNQVDVWMLGDVMYYVLTKKWVMEGHTNKETLEWYKKGKHSTISTALLQSAHPAHKAMIKAVKMAWTFDPNLRPSARAISDVLEEALISINKGKSDAPWRVQVRQLPDNYWVDDVSLDTTLRGRGSIGYRDNYHDDQWSYDNDDEE
ncbi:hypothetical protein ACHAWF_003494 [Thalassiosira exigua]